MKKRRLRLQQQKKLGSATLALNTSNSLFFKVVTVALTTFIVHKGPVEEFLRLLYYLHTKTCISNHPLQNSKKARSKIKFFVIGTMLPSCGFDALEDRILIEYLKRRQNPGGDSKMPC